MLSDRAALNIAPTQRRNVLEKEKCTNMRATSSEMQYKQHQAESFVHVWRVGIEMFPLEPNLHSVTRDLLTLVTLVTNHSPDAATSCPAQPGTGDPRHGSRHHLHHRHPDLKQKIDP